MMRITVSVKIIFAEELFVTNVTRSKFRIDIDVGLLDASLGTINGCFHSN